jgi:hypothetical protein
MRPTHTPRTHTPLLLIFTLPYRAFALLCPASSHTNIVLVRTHHCHHYTGHTQSNPTTAGEEHQSRWEFASCGTRCCSSSRCSHQPTHIHHPLLPNSHTHTSHPSIGGRRHAGSCFSRKAWCPPLMLALLHMEPPTPYLHTVVCLVHCYTWSPYPLPAHFCVPGLLLHMEPLAPCLHPVVCLVYFALCIEDTRRI